MNEIETISTNRMNAQIYPFPIYIFSLYASRPFRDAYQACIYVNRNNLGLLEYQPSRDDPEMYETSVDAMFNFATPESVIESLRMFHHDFLAKHRITVEGDNTPIESLELPPDFDNS